ncbi:MAG: SsrA-binding protein SmpB [Dongiaceae bacterium]
MAKAKTKPKELTSTGNVARNRKAGYDYHLTEKLEAGLVLTGTEVKSLRLHGANLSDAYAADRDGELFLMNAHISEYPPAARFNHAPKRPRKLLVNKKQMDRLLGAVRRDGVTIIPLSIYFNKRGIAKCEIALAKGKHKADKRASIKEKEWKREQSRAIRRK